MMKYLFFLFALPLTFSSLITKGQDLKDTSSLLYAFKNGKIEGHFRLFYMNTNNREPLTDYYALAFGGGLKYQTKSFKGFQLGIGGFYIWNLSSSNLVKPDSVTNISNRYEIGQFDQTNLSNKKDLQRLEDFFVKYNFKKSIIKFGKQVIKTPFINPQDGRMRPTGEQGLWAEINELKRIKIELGWLTHISPRGTLQWYRGGNSIGIYPSGTSISGERNDYKNSLSSKGIAIEGITYSLTKQIKLQQWNYWVDNIFNTTLLQANGEFSIKKSKKVIAGIQYIHQLAIRNGGNADPAKTYFDPGQKVNIYGLQIGYQQKNSVVRFNYTRITNDGRFLFPREWGREPLFTFLARERNEGLGDVNAFTVNSLNKIFHQKLSTEISFGYYELPDVKYSRLNKYGLPSYYQANISLQYFFDGILNGLTTELLYLYKKTKGDTYSDLKYIINKTDMHQFNLVMNYNF